MKLNRTTTEMILRLPAWAQKHIQHINGLRFDAEQLLKRFLDFQTPSKIYIWEPSVDSKKFIQDDRVYFEFSDGRMICVALDGDQIELTGYSFGNLEITPHVANQISVKLSKE